MRTAPLLLCLSTCAALWGPLPAHAQQAQTEPEGDAVAADFVGHWETDFGELVLRRDGALIRGTYAEGGSASLVGSVEGRRLRFRYQETGAAGEGWFELAEEGRLRGRWRADGQEAWSEWTGKRAQARRRSAPFSGLFETRYGRIRLRQAGAAVEGIYSYSGGQGSLSGRVQGEALRFEWREGKSAGEGEFRLGPQQVQLHGRWRSKGAAAWKLWDGQRVTPRPGVRWLVVLEAYWEEGLQQREYSFGSMLRAYFRRYPRVEVRQRRFADEADFRRHVREIAFVAEPVVLVLSSHGERGSLIAGSEHLPPELVGGCLAPLDNLALVHFSSCEVFTGDALQRLRKPLAGRALPLSGYATAVDWSASAALEFLYFDLVLGRGLRPARAASVVRKELTCAGDEGADGSPFGGLKFRFSE